MRLTLSKCLFTSSVFLTIPPSTGSACLSWSRGSKGGWRGGQGIAFLGGFLGALVRFHKQEIVTSGLE